MARALIALFVVALLAGCQKPDQVIPWAPLAPNLNPPPLSQGRAPIPLNTPACQATDLRGAVIAENSATGHLFTTIGFAGVGQCYLDGTPSIGLLDSIGHPIPFRERALFYRPSQPGRILVEAGREPTPNTGLKLGEAGVEIDWATQGDNCPGGQPIVPAKALVAIPAGGVIDMTIPAGPGAYVCEGLGVGAFEGPNVPISSSPVPPLPAISMQVPSTVPAGNALNYLVRLTNDRKQALDLVALCPTYEEELLADFVKGSPPVGGKHIFSLNCGPAGVLKPGSSVTFQMVFMVPADAPRGKYKLVFMLGYWNAMTSVSQASVTLK